MDRVVGLKLGAADTCRSPFDPAELHRARRSFAAPHRQEETYWRIAFRIKQRGSQFRKRASDEERRSREPWPAKELPATSLSDRSARHGSAVLHHLPAFEIGFHRC